MWAVGNATLLERKWNKEIALALAAIMPWPMAIDATKVVIGDSNFDLAGVGGWINDHVYLFLLIAAVAFIFFIFQKGGFAEKLLEYRLKARALDSKRLDDARALADILTRKYEGDEPRLPFGETQSEQD